MRTSFPQAVYLDLLESALYNDLRADPGRLETFIPKDHTGWIVLDEVQKIPEILDEVHRLIESNHYRFVLTGSSARKLKKRGVNLLAGRARTSHMHPLTATELGSDFKLEHALQFGALPSVYVDSDPKEYLESYVKTYLQEEVQQEGLTRNLGAFTRFLEAASFSQAGVLSVTDIARDCAVERKVVENYFTILTDLLLAVRLPVFTKRAKRRLTAHDKFFFFDVGVFRTLRPKGPFDHPEEAEGAAFETLVFQELRAINDYHSLDYSLHYWRTSHGAEVDFVLYGPKGIVAIEVKRTNKLRSKDFSGLRAFLADYPIARPFLVYGGSKRLNENGIDVIPITDFLHALPKILQK